MGTGKYFITKRLLPSRDMDVDVTAFAVDENMVKAKMATKRDFHIRNHLAELSMELAKSP